MSDDQHRPRHDGRHHWLDERRNVTRLFHGLLAVCAAVVVADLFYEKHGEYAFQHWPGFDALFGFLSYVAIVLGGVQVRKLLMRSEDYYD